MLTYRLRVHSYLNPPAIPKDKANDNLYLGMSDWRTGKLILGSVDLV